MPKPRIAVTMGDPAGVGPEVCLKILKDHTLTQKCTPIIFGDLGILERVSEQLGLDLPSQVLSAKQGTSPLTSVLEPAIFDLAAIDATTLALGTVSPQAGQASYDYVTAAIDAALAGHVAAITTGPINKAALSAAGIRYPGHTEILAARTGADHACMMQYSDAVTCNFVTTHVPYRDVPKLLSVERILQVIQLGHDAILRMRDRPPRMIACGLNPHAGEGGLFGDEEQQFIIPAINKAREMGIDISGPLPPDTAFLPERRLNTDCFVCMYHDQGHIPLKALAFDLAVNITLGLPIIRTSVDHGTAFDIAWQGKAKTSSMREAIKLATKLASST